MYIRKRPKLSKEQRKERDRKYQASYYRKNKDRIMVQRRELLKKRRNMEIKTSMANTFREIRIALKEELLDISFFQDFYTIKDLEKRFKVSKGCIYRHIKQGDVTAHKMLGKYIITGIDLKKWICGSGKVKE